MNPGYSIGGEEAALRGGNAFPHNSRKLRHQRKERLHMKKEKDLAKPAEDDRRR